MKMLKKLEYMSWLEVRDAVKETDTILIPIGAVEQQGPHLPLGTDTIAAQYVGEKVAERANVLLAPTIHIGWSQWFKNFPGMISLRKETATEILRQYCRCLAASGFKHQFFLSPHFANDDIIAEVAIELRDEGIIIGSVNLWHVTNDIIKSKNIPFKEAKFTHAGEVMTSIMMVIAPESVKMEHAVAEYAKSALPDCQSSGLFQVIFNKMTFSVFHYTEESTKSGSYGDPMAATAEKGQQVIDAWIETITEFIKTFQKYPNA
jgi:creatinine amidohydrolase